MVEPRELGSAIQIGYNSKGDHREQGYSLCHLGLINYER